MAAAESKVRLKLLVDKKNKKLLFAEASKDFVDFLFNLVSLPLGTVIRLLTKQSMVGSLGNLYDSIENLSETYLQSNQNKNSLLKPNYSPVVPLLLPEDVSVSIVPKKFYKCSYCERSIADWQEAVCPHCGNSTFREVTSITRAPVATLAGEGQGGYVRGLVTYMVTDDLVVQPMSTISCITMLNKLNVKEVGDLEEVIVDLGMTEGMKLLQASLHSKEVLSNVFLCNVWA